MPLPKNPLRMTTGIFIVGIVIILSICCIAVCSDKRCMLQLYVIITNNAKRKIVLNFPIWRARVVLDGMDHAVPMAWQTLQSDISI